MIMAASAFSDRELTLFRSLYEGNKYSESRVRALRDAVLVVPKPPTQVQRDALAESLIMLDPVAGPLDEWAKQICRYRTNFRHTALEMRFPDGRTEHFAVLYMVLQPLYLALCRLRIRPVPWRSVGSQEGSSGFLYQTQSQLHFSCNFAELLDASDVDPVSADDIYVLQDIVFEGGTKVSAPTQGVPLYQYFLSLEADRAVAAGSSTSKKSRSKQDELIHLFPWIEKALDTSEGYVTPSAPAKVSSRHDKAPSDDEDEEEALPEDVVDRELKQLLLTRMALASHKDARQDEFGTRPLGGRGTIMKTGYGHDAIQGYARTQSAQDWCVSRGLQQSMRFNNRELGNDSCGILARAFSHKMQYYMNADLGDSSLRGQPFPASLLADYVAPSEFEALKLTPTARLLVEVQKVENLFSV